MKPQVQFQKRDASNDRGFIRDRIADSSQPVEVSINSLLRVSEQIEQNTRKTKHAVRAFVLFVFYQLGFTTTGIFLYNIGSPNFQQCLANQQQCEPIWGWQILGGVILVIGLIVSSIVGWSEIHKSD